MGVISTVCRRRENGRCWICSPVRLPLERAPVIRVAAAPPITAKVFEKEVHKVLRERPPGMDPSMQLWDALARNLRKKNATVLGHRKRHARREFVAIPQIEPPQRTTSVAELCHPTLDFRSQ